LENGSRWEYSRGCGPVRTLRAGMVLLFVMFSAVGFCGSAQAALNTGSHPGEDRDARAFLLMDAAAGAERGGDHREAVRLLDAAVQTAGDLPAAYFARAELKRRESIAAWLQDIFRGLAAVAANTTWSAAVGGSLLLLTFWCLWAVCMVFVFSLGIFKAPLLFHDAREGRKTRLYMAVLAAVALPLGVVPALLAASAVMMPYLSRRERIPVFLMAVWTVLSFWCVTWAGALLSLPSIPQTKAVIEVNEDRGVRSALGVLSPGGSWETDLSLGLALSREKRFEEAIAVYEGMQSPSEKKRIRVENNIGNSYFRLGDIPRAIGIYERLHSSGNVRVLYNLSQAYREVLRFEDGDRVLREAQEADADAVTRFRAEGRVVVDETLGSLERFIFAARSPTVGGSATSLVRPFIMVVPGSALPFLGGIFIVIFAVLDRRQVSGAYYCRKCMAVVCSRCDPRGTKGTCSNCVSLTTSLETDDPVDRVARMIGVRKRHDRFRNRLRILALVPGLSDLAAGNVLRPVVLLAVWTFGLGLLVAAPPFVPYRGMVPMVTVRIAGFLAVALLYVGNFVSITRRLAKGWL